MNKSAESFIIEDQKAGLFRALCRPASFRQLRARFMDSLPGVSNIFSLEFRIVSIMEALPIDGYTDVLGN
jgi:hypothetical protein